MFKEKKTDRPILVIASGANRVDLRKIQKITGLKLGKADGTFVKERVGFALFQLKPGDLAPLTHGKWIDLSEEKQA